MIVEYTPQSYVATDMDTFFKNFSSSQVGQRPQIVSIDGGTIIKFGQVDFFMNDSP